MPLVFRVLLALGLFAVLAAVPARAQVVIEEEVEVDPSGARQVRAASPNACDTPDIQYYAQFNLAVPAYGIKYVWLEDECGLLGPEDDPVTVEISVPEGVNALAAHLSEDGSNFESQRTSLTVSFDEEHEASFYVIANTPTVSAQGSAVELVRVTATYEGTDYWGILDVVPMRFKVSYAGVSQGDNRPAKLELGLRPPTWWECKESNCHPWLALHPSVEVELQIDDRADALGTLYGPGGQSGRRVTVPYGGVNDSESNVHYKGDGPKDPQVALNPISTDVSVRPLVGSGSIYYTEVEGKELSIGGYKYDVEIAADTVAYGDSTSLAVHPAYHDGTHIDLPFEEGGVERGLGRLRLQWGGPAPPDSSTGATLAGASAAGALPSSPKPVAPATIDRLAEQAATASLKGAVRPSKAGETGDVRRIQVARGTKADRSSFFAKAGEAPEDLARWSAVRRRTTSVASRAAAGDTTNDYRSRSDCYLFGEPTPGTLVAPDTLGGEPVQGFRNGEPIDVSTRCGEYGRPTISFLPYEVTTSGQMRFVADQAKPGGVPRTIRIMAWTFEGGEYGEDEVVLVPQARYTVRLEYSVDPTTYLPEKGDRIRATATITPAPPEGSQVTFALTQADEFAFADSTTGPKTVAISSDTASVELKSLTYWGVAKVEASFTSGDGKTVTATGKQLPIDTDGDGMADSWERNNGGTAIGGNAQDGSWDEETSPGNQNDGDGIAKWDEYQGVMVGDDHQRLQPEKKEVFFDIRNARAGQFVVQEVESQLGIAVYEVEGVEGISAPCSSPGINALKWLGGFNGRGSVVCVEDRGVPNPGAGSGANLHENGVAIQNGIYSINGRDIRGGKKSQPKAARAGITMGETPPSPVSQLSGGHAKVYDGVIDNIWFSNSIPESANHTFEFAVSDSPSNSNRFGTHLWTSEYSRSDFNGNGNTTDQINPFDLLSSGSSNDAIDSIVATQTHREYLEMVTLHEVGHALGIATWFDCQSPSRELGCHPTEKPSVMRSGFGPYKTSTFTADDIAEMNLK